MSYIIREAPFFKFVISREGGDKGLLAWFEALFFQCLPRGVRACQDGLGHFFSTFACLTERGGV